MCILSSSLEEVSEWGDHLTLNKPKDLEITQGFVSLEHEKNRPSNCKLFVFKCIFVQNLS